MDYPLLHAGERVAEYAGTDGRRYYVDLDGRVRHRTRRWIDAGPVLEWMESVFAAHGGPGGDEEKFAERYGISLRTWRRVVASGQISEPMLDMLAIAQGRHPSEIDHTYWDAA